MSRIPDHIIDQIRDQANIVQIIGEHVQLKKAGRNYLGLCPFHGERTPSFNVNPERGIYKCFGCGKAGNVITFLQEHQHLSFPDAVRALATRLQIVIPEETVDDPTGMQARREEARAALREAARWFVETLHSSDGAPARRFLDKRGFTDQTVEQFGIGAAPAAWDATMKHLLANGFTEQHLEDAGLIVRTDEGKVYDRFRGRLMFPIRDDSGRVIGFSARTMASNADGPKYINSPQSLVYDKSRVLYGLDLAKRAIMQHRTAYIVEGQADVIAMHQAGFTATVASSGTALTAEHLRILTRYADRVVLVFDADKAGQSAMSRGIELALQLGFDVQCVVLSEGEDPDSFIQANGIDAMRAALDAATPWLQFQMQRYQQLGDLDDAVRKANAVRTLLEWIAGVPDPLRHPFHVRDLAEQFQLDESMLLNTVASIIRQRASSPSSSSSSSSSSNSTSSRTASPAPPRPSTTPARPAPVSPTIEPSDVLLPHEIELLKTALTEEHGLAMMLHQYRVSEESFYTSRGQRLFRHILIAEQETHDIAEYLNTHPDVEDHDRELLRAIVGSNVIPSANWKTFDVVIPAPNVARSIFDALLGIAEQRTTLQIEETHKALDVCTDDAQHQLLHRQLIDLTTRLGKLRNAKSTSSSEDQPLDLSWLDVDSTSAS